MSRCVAVVGLTVLCVCAGCSVSLRNDATEPAVTNVCQSELDCGSEGVCVNNACLARRGAIDEILLEVLPDTSGGLATESALNSLTVTSTSGLSFLVQESGIATNDRPRPVHTPPIAAITGQVTIDREYVPSCQYSGTKNPVSIDARVTFTRLGMLDGAPVEGVQSLIAQVDTYSNQQAKAFSASLFAGDYEVYVEPSCYALAPPLLMVGVDVQPVVRELDPPALLSLPAPRQLSGAVSWSNGSFKDWTISLVESRRGRRISTVQQLGSVSPTNFSIRYQPVISMDGSDPGSPLIQIAPPPRDPASGEPSTAPTMYWVLSGVDLNGSGKVALDASGVPTEDKLIEVSGLVRDPSQKGVESRLLFFSTNLEGSSGIFANLSVSTSTDQMGHYIVGLLPGEYRVVAVPMDAQKPIVEPADAGPAGPIGPTPWAITERSASFGGPTSFDIQLDPKVTIAGTAMLAPGGIPAVGASVQFTPTTAEGSGTLINALARTAVLPSAPTPIRLDVTGKFGISLDPGFYDVSIRPDDGSNYGWWVYPRFEVSAKTPPRLDAVLPLPVAFDGQVFDGTTALDKAVVKAFAKASDGKSTIQVGATHTDQDGRFRLRVPSALAPQP